MEENAIERRKQVSDIGRTRIVRAAVVVGLVLVLVAGGYLLVARTGIGERVLGIRDIGPVAARADMQSFVRDGLGVPANIEVTVSEPIRQSGLYKATVTIQKKDYPMYLSLDGATFFPNAIDSEAVVKAKAAAAPKEVPKSSKPDVRLFVMSYCPYGTQIEKGILPVLAALGDKIDFKLEFVDYAMHNNKATNDRKELDENLREYCIRTQEPSKLTAYLSCFLKKGQGTESACLRTAGVNASQNAACMKAADTEFDVTKNFNDQSTYQGNYPPFNVDKADNEKYSVQGSPSLVINGVTSDSQRDPASLLKAICAAFDTAPSECDQSLSSTAPSAGFGDGTASSGSASSGAACGN
ncbi:MAG TPA: hypothetical protein VN420_02640 [Candidatus Fimivivens sp.]|nr:hypothetical protein [Candidatus Fimivivens sp.]